MNDETERSLPRTLAPLTKNPFDEDKQQKFKHILNDVIPHLETPVIEVIEWLSTYIKVEEFGDAEAIRMDLDDPHYSDIRNSMQQKFKWSQEHLDLVLCLLREDIFSDHARNDR